MGFSLKIAHDDRLSYKPLWLYVLLLLYFIRRRVHRKKDINELKISHWQLES